MAHSPLALHAAQQAPEHGAAREALEHQVEGAALIILELVDLALVTSRRCQQTLCV